MSNRQRQHLTEHGKPKLSYETRKEAKHMILRMKAEGVHTKGLQAYHCSVCGRYHIGHSRPQPPFESYYPNSILEYLNGKATMKVRPTDRRWAGKTKQLEEALDELLSHVRAIYGAYNNALFLMMGNAIDGLRHTPLCQHLVDEDGIERAVFTREVKMLVNKVWKAYRQYEGELKHGEMQFMSVKGLSDSARSYYKEDITDEELYDFWCACGVEPYYILKKWGDVLANKYRLLLQRHNVSCAEEISHIMVVMDLLGHQEEMWQHTIKNFTVNLGLQRPGMEQALQCFRMIRVQKEWQKLLFHLCPMLRVIHPDDLEQKNIDASKQQILEHVDTSEFYFGGAVGATEEYTEVFRTQGTNKKALRMFADVRRHFAEVEK